ncbi:hypothetical protein E2562_002264 [Oryza meyeriana var. granulata]|uniref:Protein TIC 22, chloroplastic n=1 Tax=Oryza meyeriana var. granulata TaxID=110450 RepID=A0A6G1BGT1_9ORYZ|nr:hypothetical protein E2562_002264 [Oryza meyeriana var. granulata]
MDTSTWRSRNRPSPHTTRPHCTSAPRDHTVRLDRIRPPPGRFLCDAVQHDTSRATTLAVRRRVACRNQQPANQPDAAAKLLLPPARRRPDVQPGPLHLASAAQPPRCGLLLPPPPPLPPRVPLRCPAAPRARRDGGAPWAAGNEFVLVSDPATGLRSLGLLCFRSEDADALLTHVRTRQPVVGKGAKVVPITLDQVYMLKAEGIAFRFLPDPLQIKNALELKSGLTAFDGVPVFQRAIALVRVIF